MMMKPTKNLKKVEFNMYPRKFLPMKIALILNEELSRVNITGHSSYQKFGFLIFKALGKALTS